MNSDKRIRTRVFQYNSQEVRLLFEIEQVGSMRRLILHDAIGQSIEHIMSVPDEIIESEACLAASDDSARYI
jgi:hypothetical protein